VSWKLANLADIPALGPAAEREYWERWTRILMAGGIPGEPYRPA
jgi:hypothetical protein